MSRYQLLPEIAMETRPRRIVEVGTHNGVTGVAICKAALQSHDDPVHYVGYDLFEDADEANDVAEMNGKSRVTYAEAEQRFHLLRIAYPDRFSFELVRGNTRETLHGKQIEADFVWLDGGHSEDTIRGDFAALSHASVLACDDYYTGEPTPGFGCNCVVGEDWFISKPDHRKGGGVSIAIRGWAPHDQTACADPEWRDTVAQLMEENQAKTVYEYRGGAIRAADCIVGLDCWDNVADLKSELWKVRAFARRIVFLAFDVKKRPVAEIEAALAKSFIVTDRVETPDAFMVTGKPVKEVPEVITKGAGADEERLSHARANIKRIKRRVPMPVQAHGRTAALVCYGPSLAGQYPVLAEMAKGAQVDVITVSAAHDFCIERGMVPDYHVESDPRAHKAKHMKRAHRGVHYYFASCVHPAYVAKVLRGRGDLSLWHCYEGKWSDVISTEYDPGWPMVMGGSNVGLRACMLFHALGYRKFEIFGMDCSFGEAGEQHAGQHAGKAQSETTFTCNGKQFRSSMLNIGYARQFLDMVRFLTDVSWRVHGDGLLRNMLESIVKENQTQKEAA
jgi:hypothetical protein